MPENKSPKQKKASMFGMLRKYWHLSLILAIGVIAGNALGLFVPKYISWGIDMYSRGEAITQLFYIQFLLLAAGIFILTYFQGVFQTYLAEKAASDIREDLADKISRMTFARLESETPAKLLTNLTSDIDAVKTFLSMGIGTVISSLVVIIGAAILLARINWKLALMVLTLLPLIGIMFFLVFRKLGPLFKKSQEIIDGFNTIISESVMGSAIVRVFDSGRLEHVKFAAKNTEGKTNGMTILGMFSLVIPTIAVIANAASLVILLVGGGYVMSGTMTIGDFTAFNSYVFILIFPIIMLGFVSNIISRAQASYDRIKDVLNLTEEKDAGIYDQEIKGNLEVKGVELTYGEKKVLRDVSFSIPAKTKTAIIGPTAAGKTQLLQVLMGLTTPQKGEVTYDGKPIAQYVRQSLYSQIALVFQDSSLFNMSVRENIGFSASVKDADIAKAIETAELGDFIHTLPKGLDTIVSERGTSLSGGQKQRIMLARALAVNPKVLLLDDFTARVDTATERKILANIAQNYPDVTVISVTQKIQSVEQFDKIILLMEGEVIAQGTHAQLAQTSPEYVQIMESQKSTEEYEKKHH